MPYKDKNKKREYDRQWMQARRQAWFAVNGPCVKCGTWENLELDHKDPSTKITHNVWSWAEERREIELAKCQVLCVACHMEKSIFEMHRPIRHGTRTSYSYHKCRCIVCVESMRNYFRNNRVTVNGKRVYLAPWR